MAALYVAGDRSLYVRVISAWGVKPFRFPFLDTDTVLSALRCLRAGVDVFTTNPCDPLRRVFDYSPLWLAAAVLPVTKLWIVPVGLSIDAMFLLSLLLLPPGRNAFDTALIVAGAISTAAVYGLERGNNDLIIFALAAGAASLVCRNRPTRLFGYGLAFFAGLLKYYPMMLMVLALRERPRLFWLLVLASMIGLGTFVAVEGHDLLRALRLVPSGSLFSDMFGAKTLPRGLRQLAWLPRHDAVPMQWMLVLGAFAAGCLIGSRPTMCADLGELTEEERVFLSAGALVILGCFLTAQNIGYRAVLVLLVLPGLSALWRVSGRLYYGLSTGIALLLLWAEGWRHWLNLALGTPEMPTLTRMQVLAWLLREAAWWWLVTLLFALLAGLLFRDGFGRAIASSQAADRVRLGCSKLAWLGRHNVNR